MRKVVSLSGCTLQADKRVCWFVVWTSWPRAVRSRIRVRHIILRWRHCEWLGMSGVDSFDSPCYHQKFGFAFSTTKFGVVMSFIFIFSCDYGVNVFLPLDTCAPKFFSWVAPQLCTFPFSMHFPRISFTFCMAVTSALHFVWKLCWMVYFLFAPHGLLVVVASIKAYNCTCI